MSPHQMPPAKASFLDQPIMKRNIFELFGDCISGAGELCGKAAGMLSDGVGAIGGGFQNVSTFLGGGFGTTSDSAPQRVQAPVVAMEQPEKAKATAYDCTMNDVVCPMVPKMATQSAGIGPR